MKRFRALGAVVAPGAVVALGLLAVAGGATRPQKG
jgi:hypothetical protein